MTNKEEVTKCPECLETCSQEELDLFGGLCEQCNFELQNPEIHE